MLEFGTDGCKQKLLLCVGDLFLSDLQTILIFSMVMMCAINDFAVY